jgi:hypothetical protein
MRVKNPGYWRRESEIAQMQRRRERVGARCWPVALRKHAVLVSAEARLHSGSHA